MIREEEIRQASIEHTMKNAPKCISGDAFSEVMDGMNRNYTFEEGAKWADKTMIDKACKWLLKGGYFVNNTETINDFNKQWRNSYVVL